MSVSTHPSVRILTGIQSTGIPHLGNILGAILPAIQLSKTSQEPAYFMIADLHTFTATRDSNERRYYTQATAAAWLACGLDPDKAVLYRQSQIPEVCELAWYLSCLTPYPMLANAHAFKDKSSNLATVNVGLFIYPVLMAADILLYQATHVPVGPDQQQHLEITRDIARTANHLYGQLFPLPEAYIAPGAATVPGTDGRKMSKSYHNTLTIFLDETPLKQAIMSIPTDSTSMAAPKNPDTCPIFRLYQLVAPPELVDTMVRRYREGNYGYGAAKQALFEALLGRFKQERKLFAHYMAHPTLLTEQLQQGEAKARVVARENIQRIREAVGATNYE